MCVCMMCVPLPPCVLSLYCSLCACVMKSDHKYRRCSQTSVHMCVWVCACECVCFCVLLIMCICDKDCRCQTSSHTCICCLCVYVCMCVHVCVCVCVCVCACACCIYKYTRSHHPRRNTDSRLLCSLRAYAAIKRPVLINLTPIVLGPGFSYPCCLLPVIYSTFVCACVCACACEHVCE